MSNPLEDLKLVMELMNRPIPQAIWFIDETARYYQVLSSCTVVEREPVLSFNISIEGLPLREWRLHEIEDKVRSMELEGFNQERIDNIFPFKEKGVWVQMSNGKHIEIVFKDKGNE